METFVNHSITHKKSAHVACNEFVLNHVFANVNYQCIKTNVQLQIQRRSEHICLLRSNCNRMNSRDAPWPHYNNTDVLLSQSSRLIVIWIKLKANYIPTAGVFYLFGVNTLWFSIFLTQEIIVASTKAPDSLTTCKCLKNCSKSLICALHHRLVKLFISFLLNISGMDLQTQLLSSFY